MKLTPDQMVSPKAIAPFEAAMAFQQWSARATAEGRELGINHQSDPQACQVLVDGLGPANPMTGETHREWGERMAVALFTLIKEI